MEHTHSDVKNLMVVFAIARKELSLDREQIKELISLEERVIKILEDEYSRNEADNGAGS
jgi:hypothetical protein